MTEKGPTAESENTNVVGVSIDSIKSVLSTEQMKNLELNDEEVTTLRNLTTSAIERLRKIAANDERYEVAA